MLNNIHNKVITSVVNVLALTSNHCKHMKNIMITWWC